MLPRNLYHALIHLRKAASAESGLSEGDHMVTVAKVDLLLLLEAHNADRDQIASLQAEVLGEREERLREREES
jgi:hypothetical protein